MFNWSNQVILLTGGTGSFGQAFTRYLLKHHPPKILRIFSRDEFKQYQMQQQFDHPCLRYFIGDVRDRHRLNRAMDGVTVVVHAAALKQIVASEYNPSETIMTNIIGTMNVIDSAIDAKVERIIGLITDKAVAPINLYGATKLCAEKLLIHSRSYVGNKKIKISCVRYGNVVGSRGSVLPLFLQQKKTGQLTITHKDTTRFWISLEQSIKFVISAAEKMLGSEIFIPKMPSFRVFDLVNLIAPGAKKKIIGLRPGEKLHEDLINVHEANRVLSFRNYYLIKPEFILWSGLEKELKYGGQKVSPNFSYNSLTNPEFLTSTQLKQQLSKLKII